MSLANTIRGLSLLASTVSLAVRAPASAGTRSGIIVIRINSVELSCPIPYRTGKVPVVFIHGMLGSPDNWSVMIERSRPTRRCTRTSNPSSSATTASSRSRTRAGTCWTHFAKPGGNSIPRGETPPSTGSSWWVTAWADWSPRRRSAPETRDLQRSTTAAR